MECKSRVLLLTSWRTTNSRKQPLTSLVGGRCWCIIGQKAASAAVSCHQDMFQSEAGAIFSLVQQELCIPSLLDLQQHWPQGKLQGPSFPLKKTRFEQFSPGNCSPICLKAWWFLLPDLISPQSLQEEAVIVCVCSLSTHCGSRCVIGSLFHWAVTFQEESLHLCSTWL